MESSDSSSSSRTLLVNTAPGGLVAASSDHIWFYLTLFVGILLGVSVYLQYKESVMNSQY